LFSRRYKIKPENIKIKAVSKVALVWHFAKNGMMRKNSPTINTIIPQFLKNIRILSQLNFFSAK